jgi:hypothetical protein
MSLAGFAYWIFFFLLILPIVVLARNYMKKLRTPNVEESKTQIVAILIWCVVMVVLIYVTIDFVLFELLDLDGRTE